MVNPVLCAHCNVEFITCIPDKRLQRTLNEMKVYCSNKGLGCKWIGELGSLSLNLNTETEISDQEASYCLFASLGCVFCGNKFLRKELGEHKSNRCPKRPYSCDYCNDFMSPLVKMSPPTTGQSALATQCRVPISVGYILNYRILIVT